MLIFKPNEMYYFIQKEEKKKSAATFKYTDIFTHFLLTDCIVLKNMVTLQGEFQYSRQGSAEHLWTYAVSDNVTVWDLSSTSLYS